MYSYIEGHTDRVVIVGEHSENDYAVSELGAVMVPGLTAKAIVVGNYVYVGSVNLDYESLHNNRELGIIIENPVVAEEVRDAILQWYSEYASGTTQQGEQVSRGLQLPTTTLLLLIILLILFYTARQLMRPRRRRRRHILN
jgi:phosphatidylserine/phosphatidylglycerophosphate/cardiolipin synthase-like enzyme